VTTTAVRGFLASMDTIPILKVVFQFNPETMRDDKRVEYTEEPAGTSDDVVLRYTGAGLRTLSFTLQLHGWERGRDPANATGVDNGVSTDLAVLRSFLYPRASPWAQLAHQGDGWLSTEPPLCVFGFGSRVLHCHVSQLAVTEQQYNSTLAPVRATVEVTLTVVEQDDDPLSRLDRQQRLVLAAAAVVPRSVDVQTVTTDLLGRR
jgi:hypothetical protein